MIRVIQICLARRIRKFIPKGIFTNSLFTNFPGTRIADDRAYPALATNKTKFYGRILLYVEV